jgi:hypothetical protein
MGDTFGGALFASQSNILSVAAALLFGFAVGSWWSQWKGGNPEKTKNEDKPSQNEDQGSDSSGSDEDFVGEENKMVRFFADGR